MEQLAAVAVVVALILGAVFFLLNGKPKSFLDKTRQKLKLGKIVKITHDVTLFRFDLPSPSMALGLPVGKHVKIYAPNRTGVEAGNWNGREDPEAEVGEIQ